jgi:hypothetical protein
VSTLLIGVLGVLVVVFIVKMPRKPPELPRGQATFTPLPETIDVSGAKAERFLSPLAGYSWFATVRTHPAELLAGDGRLAESSRDRYAKWLQASLNDVPPGQIREWTGILAAGYGQWVADLNAPLDPLPASWRRLDVAAHGVPVYQVDGPERWCGFVIVPNAKVVVAATRISRLDALVVGVFNADSPPRAGLFGSSPVDAVFSDLKWMRSPLAGVSLGPPPKELPPAGSVNALLKPVDWVKDFGGGKASGTWKDGDFQIEASFVARDDKTAAAIAGHLEEHRTRLLGGASGAGATPFAASGKTITYKAKLSPADLEAAAPKDGSTK